MIRSVRILFLLALLLVTISCKKEPDDPIPNPTYYDDMTATINGQAWKASCTPSWPGMGCTKVSCQYYSDTQSFELFGTDQNTAAIKIYIGPATGGIKLGINQIPYIKEILTCGTTTCVTNNCQRYELDTTSSALLTILNIDSENKVIEGKFSFCTTNKSCLDTICVSGGYFKTKYRP